MTAHRPARSVLPPVLADLAEGPYPEYIDDVLASTARTRQRPAWTFPERWLGRVGIAGEPELAPRLPRAIAIAILVMALLLAAYATLLSSGQPRVPAPFGPARNGVVAYESGGDIYTADPAGGTTREIVAGPETDVGPRFSLDGTHIVFERRLGGGRGQLYVARADGGGLRLVTPEPIVLASGASGTAWEKYEFSPDGRTILISLMKSLVPTIALAQVDGSGVRYIDVGMEAIEPAFRPPDGSEILFVGRGDGGRGLYAVDPATGVLRTIVDVPPGNDLAGASWSPDGSRIAYWTWNETVDGMSARSRVVHADGSNDRELPAPGGAVWNAHATWSNDGKQIFVAHGFSPGMDDVRGMVAPADGSSVGVEVAPAGMVEIECCAAWTWSPDDTLLIGRYASLSGEFVQLVFIDPMTRTARPAPWTTSSDPSWQRLAP